MKIKNFGMARWVGRLLLVVCLMVSSAGAAHAWIINGSVTNNTARSGRVYMSLQQNGGDTGLGLSIPAPAPGTTFQIQGVPNGTYTLKAFVDGSGTGRLHPADPTWSSPGAITISGSDHTLDSNTTVNFTTAPSVTAVAPAGAQIMPGDNGAFVVWDEPKDISGNKIADSYKVYYSTLSTTPRSTPDGVITVPASDRDFALLHIANGTPLHVQVTALVGTQESAASTVATTTINPPTPSGFTITGTINLSGVTNPTGNLYIALVDQTGKGGPVAVAYVANPPQSSNTFTITTNSTSVPNGTYSLYALIDMNSDGKISSGDVMPSEQSAPTVIIDGASHAVPTVTLTKSNSTPFINTTHYQDSSTPPNESYNVVLGAKAQTEVLTNFTVNSGPSNGLSYPIDLGLNSWGEFQAGLNVNSNRPQPADAYNVTINYANGVAAETLNLYPTVVLDSFATSLAPAGTYPFASITNSATTNFTWGAPATPPALTPYTYSLWSSIPGFPGNNNQYSNMPSSTLAQSVSGLTYSDGVTNGWTVSVQDAAGNQAQKSVTLTYTSALVITSFSPATVLPGDVVTINGINFNTTAANNTISFSGGVLAQAATATATQLTVVVPANALSGSLQVTDTVSNKTSQSSAAQLNVLQTLTVTGQVSDATTTSAIASATVTAAFTVNSTPRIRSAITDVNGNFTLTGVPQNTNFTLSFTASGYASAYTGTINTNGNSLPQSMALYPSATFNTWNASDATTGVIRGQVYDLTSSPGIAGVTITSTVGTVMYDNGSGNTPVAGVSTGSNGIFYITHVLGSVSITATKSGYIINPIAATGYAGTVTGIIVPASPSISVSGTITNSAKTGLTGATIAQVGTSNTTTSTTGGAFTISNLPGGTSFELKMSQDPTYVPTYSGWLTSTTSFALPLPFTLFTPAELTSFGINTPAQGAIIGLAVNSANFTAPLSGVQVSAGRPGYQNYTVRYFDQTLNGGLGGFSTSPSTTATDASGMFLVVNVDDGASVNISAFGASINGATNITTHAPGVSEIAVPCNVPSPTFANLQTPPSATITTNQSLTAHGRVSLNNVTNSAGPATGLTAFLGYGPVGSSPSSPSWTWIPATYSTWDSLASTYDYGAMLPAPSAGSYDYAFRYSYFGGPYVYGDLSGIEPGDFALPNAGKLTVTPLIATTTTLISDHTTSIYGQGVTFTATVSTSAATGTMQLYVDGSLVASSTVSGGNATFSPITNITVGSHTITAAYSGDATYAVSTSAGLPQTVIDGIMIGSTGNFLTLQSAITAALNTDIVSLRDTRFAEDLLVNRTLPFTITLNGGLSSDFLTAVGTTSVRTLTIQQGRINVFRLVVKPD